MKVFLCAFYTLALLTSSVTFASDLSHHHISKYSGQENRSIKSLSPDDIYELKRGGGWGLAKAAELNGVPGPVHLLELKDQIDLSASQVLEIRKIYESMKVRAAELGQELINLEQELEQHFRKRTITDHILRSSLAQISEVRNNLRYTHLSAHLKTPDILTEQQIAAYNSLRGYGNTDLCKKVPKGHNASMWRKHNGCD